MPGMKVRMCVEQLRRSAARGEPDPYRWFRLHTKPRQECLRVDEVHLWRDFRACPAGQRLAFLWVPARLFWSDIQSGKIGRFNLAYR